MSQPVTDDKVVPELWLAVRLTTNSVLFDLVTAAASEGAGGDGVHTD